MLRFFYVTLLIVLGPLAASAQPAGPMPDQLQAGIAAFGSGDLDAAYGHLRPLFEEAPAYYLPGHGSAAYWLGRVLEAQEDTATALKTWRRGLQALAAERRLDPLLSDRFVRSVFRDSVAAEIPAALVTYRTLLARAPGDDANTDAVLQRHIAQLLPLWPEADRPRLAAPVRLTLYGTLPRDLDRLDLRPDAGPQAAAWWDRQLDPVLSTQQNERLIEHLRRVALAESRYACERCLTGYDDRGEVFVRLGPPQRFATVPYDDPKLIEILKHPRGPFFSRDDFPDNEIWTYPRLGKPFDRYVFVERGHQFQAARLTDLLPIGLSSGITNSKRGAMKVYILEAVLAYIQEVLMETHTGYGDELGAGTFFAAYRLGMEAMNGLGSQAAYQVVERPTIFLEAQQEANRYASRVLETLPQQHTQVLEAMEPLPVVFRLARFLQADGTTRTAIFWTHPEETFEEDYGLVDFFTAQYTAENQRRDLFHKQYAPVRDVAENGLSIRTENVRGDTGLYHLQLQWIQEPGRERSFRIDSIRALNPDPTRLEMSDLLPAVEVAVEATTAGVQLTPYPMPAVTPDLPLMLYFEVYHLTFDGDDRTRYTVEVEVEKREEGKLSNLFRDRTERISARTQMEGAERAARETVGVDLGSVAGADGLIVTVRVTDEVTGATVERTLTFNVQEG